MSFVNQDDLHDKTIPSQLRVSIAGFYILSNEYSNLIGCCLTTNLTYITQCCYHLK